MAAIRLQSVVRLDVSIQIEGAGKRLVAGWNWACHGLGAWQGCLLGDLAIHALFTCRTKVGHVDAFCIDATFVLSSHKSAAAVVNILTEREIEHSARLLLLVSKILEVLELLIHNTLVRVLKAFESLLILLGQDQKGRAGDVVVVRRVGGGSDGAGSRT